MLDWNSARKHLTTEGHRCWVERGTNAITPLPGNEWYRPDTDTTSLLPAQLQDIGNDWGSVHNPGFTSSCLEDAPMGTVDNMYFDADKSLYLDEYGQPIQFSAGHCDLQAERSRLLEEFQAFSMWSNIEHGVNARALGEDFNMANADASEAEVQDRLLPCSACPLSLLS